MHINPSSVPSQHKVFEHGIPALEKKKGVRGKKAQSSEPLLCAQLLPHLVTATEL